MRLHKKYIFVFSCLIMILTLMLSVTGCNGSGNKQSKKSGLKKVTVCLDWTPNTNHTGLYVALEKGYYEDAGLDVQIVQPPEGGAAAMCASGQAQFAIEAQDTMAAALDQEEPLTITAVAGILQHNTSGIIARAGEGLDSPKGLEGKTYSTWDSPIELAMIKHVMEAEGADYDKMKRIPNDITNEPAALEAKQTDAVWIFYGWSGIHAEQYGLDFDYWSFADCAEELDYYTPVIIANNDYLEDNKEQATAFMEATKKGYLYAVTEPKKAADILIKGDTTGSLRGMEDLVYASQQWLADMYLNEDGQWGIMDESRWNGFYKWLYENELTSHDLSGKGFSNEYLEIE